MMENTNIKINVLAEQTSHTHQVSLKYLSIVHFLSNVFFRLSSFSLLRSLLVRLLYELEEGRPVVFYTEKAFTKCNRKGNINTKSFGIMKFDNKQNSLVFNK